MDNNKQLQNCSCITSFLLIGIPGCKKSSGKENELSVTEITDEEAVHYAQNVLDDVSPALSEDLDISLWASEKLMRDPVQVHFDHQVRAWIAITDRRRAEISLGSPYEHFRQKWSVETLSWQTVEVRHLDLPATTTVSLVEVVLENGTLDERQIGLQTLGRIDDPASFEVLERKLEMLITGELDREIKLDVILAVESVRSASLHCTVA